MGGLLSAATLSDDADEGSGTGWAGEWVAGTAGVEEWPRFPGAVLLQMRAPKPGQDSLASVSAADGDASCQAYCHQGPELGLACPATERSGRGGREGDGARYGACSGRVRLSEEAGASSPVAFSPYRGQALYLAWQQRVRAPTYLLFLCPPSSASHKLIGPI